MNDPLPNIYYFQNETNKLWKFATDRELFKFRTVDNVLEENHRLKREVTELKNTLAMNMTDLAEKINQNEMATVSLKH